MTSVLQKKQVHEIGDQVEAKIKAWKQFYKGKVTAYDGQDNTYSVEFEDGDKQSGIKSFNIKALKKEEVFTAPDGKTFSTKAEYRKYMKETFYSAQNLTDAKVEKKEGEIAGQTFTINNLTKCEVKLMDHSDQILIDGVTDCKILVGPSSDSVFVRKAKNCHFFIACKQFRCRDCESCTVSLYSKTEPVVETSTKMRFYPYGASYPNQTAHFKKANLEPTHNHWCNIYDFNKGDASIPEPHWELVPEEEGWEKWEMEGGENPVPKEARAEVVPKETGFAIGTPQQVAQQQFQQQQQEAVPPAPVATSEAAPAHAPPVPTSEAAPAHAPPVPTSEGAPVPAASEPKPPKEETATVITEE